MSDFSSKASLLKIPPHSIEAEQSVLGGILLDNNAYDQVINILTEFDFYRKDHAKIYSSIKSLISNNIPADVITVAEYIKKTGHSSIGIDYLNSLVQIIPSIANILGYAEIIRDKSILRRLIYVSNSIIQSALFPENRHIQTILDEAESKILAISEEDNRSRVDFFEITELLADVVSRIDELHHNKNNSGITGVATGFIDLDRYTSGFQKGDFIIIAGRPSMGKAQPMDALIKTIDNWKKMKDIQLGDYLASIDGSPSYVTGIYPQGKKQIYEIIFSDNRRVECCAEHLWRIHYSNKQVTEIVSTQYLIDFLKKNRSVRSLIWIDYVNGNFGHNKLLIIDPYILGHYFSKKCKLKKDGIHIYDLSLERMRNFESLFIQKEHVILPIGLSKWKIKYYFYESVINRLNSSQKNVQMLINQIFHVRRIPKLYLNANKLARQSLLSGILSWDGQIKDSGTIEYQTNNEMLALDIIDLIRSLGSSCDIQKKRKKYILNIYFPNIEIRKYYNIQKQRLAKPPHLYIKKIKKTRISNAQCISVDHFSKEYITQDYVITHNTAFSTNIAENIAMKENLPVLIFSMEMSATQLTSRILGSVGRINQSRMRTGQLREDEWPKITDAIFRLNETRIIIDESGTLSSLELRARSRRITKKYGTLGLIVVDYLQLMSANNANNNENRVAEISEISRSLKSLAKELQCPVLALSQLNRSLEQRINKRPVMSDLRESGAIEQDADLILFIYRDEVYHSENMIDKGIAEIIIAKQRNGPIGTIKLNWQGQFTRFDNLAESSTTDIQFEENIGL